MFLTRFGVSRPIVVRMVLILIVIFGLYAYGSMPRFLDPDITIGEGMIITLCPGFSPEEMESLVTKKIEDELKGISEIRRFESNSFESTSKIHVFFNTRLSEYEIDQAMQEVRNAVDRVDDLPEEAKVPRVVEIDVAIFPVCMVGLAGNLSMMQLQDIAEEIADTFDEIKGVSEVNIVGEREGEIWVELNPRRMSSYGISIPQVARAIAGRTKNLPGGTVEMGGHETAIRMVGEPQDPGDIGDIVLRSIDGGTVHLRDIARITPTLEKARTLTFIDKENALVLAIKRKKDTNMIQIVNDVKRLMKDIPAQYPGLRTTLYFDQSREIKKRIKELQNNGLMGIALVFLILWVSMGLRNALFASVGIPVAFLLTFILMKIFGLSINGLTLFGLILVLGVVVDDAIVVLENIFRHWERGKPILQATLEGSREVLAPVLASVSTTMAAFLPILFLVGGVIGRYLEDLPKVVLFALAASLFEVFFMLPSHVVELTPKDMGKEAPKKRLDMFAPLRKIYYPYLRVILRHRYFSVLFIALSTVLAFFLYFQTDFIMFPKSDVFPRFNIYFDLPANSTLDRCRATLMELSDLIKERVGDELEAPIAVAGMKEINYEPIYGTHFGMLMVILKGKKDRKHSIVEIMERVREDTGRLLTSLGVTSYIMERMIEGPPVGADVDLKIQSPDWESSAKISRLLREELSRHKGIVDIRDDATRDKHFMEITLDEEKGKNLGVDQDHLVMAVQAAFHGLAVATYNRGDENQDIKLKYLPRFRRDFDDLVNLKVMVPGQGPIPLKELAEIRLTPGFHNIYHYNGKQTVRLTANISEKQEDQGGAFLSNLMGEKMTAVRANSIAREYFETIRANFPGARMIAGGLQDETNTSLVELGRAGMLAIFLIFFILCLQFNSFTQPLIIMVTIPFASLGVMVGLLVSNNPLTFVTLIGLLTLTGIVVNDSLVLIDFINRYRKEYPRQLYRAIIEACHVRMRPIILTSITTICGLAPMAFGVGGKSIFWAPLATAIMWGLAFATVLILSMVPAFYAILQDAGYLIRHRRWRRADTRGEIDRAFAASELRPFMKERPGPDA
ncbi:MAG: efflux RND transporter permease subunit [Deltaproteobacteria bacterium]|nr:efflux RND transporter permease subunit [Deltaproteobacteria bacterium]MBW2047170.1 efflux RND transporter permease subunit [Deltaproteobacteria bacterium]MBW2352557.1 efflux RND transporter permease subunit [Deltaproteobacteria bacterium]